MDAPSEKEHLPQISVAEDCGAFYKLHFKFASVNDIDCIDVELSVLAVRIVVLRQCRTSDNSEEPSHIQVPLPREVDLDGAIVKRHRRAQELRLHLPWGSEADKRAPVMGASSPDDVALGLETVGYHVIDGLLDKNTCTRIADLASRWHDSGHLRPGVVGNSATPLAPLAKVRGDVMTHLKDEDDAHVASLLRRMDAIVLGLTQRVSKLSRVTHRSRAMLAVYPPGSNGYVRHVDNRPGSDPNDRRRLTCIYYVNHDWQKAHGGALRLHCNDGEVDVEPFANRFVCFWADTLEHEVLPTRHVSRAAVSAWYSEATIEPTAQQTPELRLPVKAVHGMATQLKIAGAVRLPDWLVPPIGPLTSAELSSAAQALQSVFHIGTAEVSNVILGRGLDAFHDSLRSLSEVSAKCYCNASRVVAACVDYATRMLRLLVDAKAPGWTGTVLAEASPPRACAVRASRGWTPMSDFVPSETQGCMLHCIYGLDGTHDFQQTAASLASENLCLQVGDVLLVAGARALRQAAASSNALCLEVCAVQT